MSRCHECQAVLSDEELRSIYIKECERGDVLAAWEEVCFFCLSQTHKQKAREDALIDLGLHECYNVLADDEF